MEQVGKNVDEPWVFSEVSKEKMTEISRMSFSVSYFGGEEMEEDGVKWYDVSRQMVLSHGKI